MPHSFLKIVHGMAAISSAAAYAEQASAALAQLRQPVRQQFDLQIVSASVKNRAACSLDPGFVAAGPACGWNGSAETPYASSKAFVTISYG